MMNLLHAEWIKFASLRASWTKVVITIVLYMAIVVVGLVFFEQAIGDAEPDTSIPTRIGTVSGGVTLAALVLAVLGVTVFTNEIKSRSIIPTVAAVPDRREFVGAKTLLTGIVALVVGAVTVLIGAATTMIVLDQKGFPLSFDDTDYVRVLFGSVAYLTIAALFGLGVGIVANSATGGIAVALLWPTAIESTLQAFLPDWVARFLPFEAGGALIAVPARGDLPAWEGGGVFLAWSVGIIIAGYALFRRRDLGAS